MEKQCKTCEFNFNGICAGSGGIYKYGEAISDDTKICEGWSGNLKFFMNEIATAPPFLRNAYNSCSIAYSEFMQKADDFKAGKSVPLHIFDAIKYIYGLSMVDIAVLLDVTYGVVYRAKTKGFVSKRISQFSDALCIPEEFLFNVTTTDFDQLLECKKNFFAQPHINDILESMPDWKMQLAQVISQLYVHCPMHIAKTIARVDNLYWESRFAMTRYTESEQTLIHYVTRNAKSNMSIHRLEYSLDIGCHPRMHTSMSKESH